MQLPISTKTRCGGRKSHSAEQAANPGDPVLAIRTGSWSGSYAFEIGGDDVHLLLVTATADGAKAQSSIDRPSRDVSTGRFDLVSFVPAGTPAPDPVTDDAGTVLIVPLPTAAVASVCGGVDPAPWRSATEERRPRIVAAARALARASIAGRASSVDLLNRLLTRLVATTFGSLPRRSDDSWLHPAAIERVAALVHANDAAGLTLAAMAGTSGLGTSAFSRAFRGSVGITPGEFVIDYRLRLAADLLATTDLQVAEIARRLHLSSVPHFTAQFHARFGQRPTTYRASSRRSDRTTPGRHPQG